MPFPLLWALIFSCSKFLVTRPQSSCISCHRKIIILLFIIYEFLQKVFRPFEDSSIKAHWSKTNDKNNRIGIMSCNESSLFVFSIASITEKYCFCILIPKFIINFFLTKSLEKIVLWFPHRITHQQNQLMAQIGPYGVIL